MCDISFSNINKVNIVNDLYNNNLKGKVFSEIIYSYEVKDSFGIIVKGKQNHNQKYIYDKQGNIIESIYYNFNGDIIYKKIKEYDIKNNLISEVEYKNNDSLILLKRKYNINNNLIEEFKNGKLATWLYDKNDNMIESDSYNEFGKLTRKWKNKYNSNNNYTESILYDSTGKITIKWIVKYDLKNNKIESLKFTSDGLLEEKEKYFYNSKNQLFEKFVYNSKDEIINIFKYEYEKNGILNIIEYNGLESCLGNVYKYDTKWLKNKIDIYNNYNSFWFGYDIYNSKNYIFNSENYNLKLEKWNEVENINASNLVWLKFETIHRVGYKYNSSSKINCVPKKDLYNILYKINSKGQIIELNKTDDYGLEKKDLISYDLNDNIISIYTFTFNKNKESNQMNFNFDYEYDKNQNWVTRLQKENEIPKVLIERKMEYYK